MNVLEQMINRTKENLISQNLMSYKCDICRGTYWVEISFRIYKKYSCVDQLHNYNKLATITSMEYSPEMIIKLYEALG